MGERRHSSYDLLETRTPEQRSADLVFAMPRQVAHAIANAPGIARHLAGVDPEAVTNRAALARLPLLRRSDLREMQAAEPPFGGLTSRRPTEMDHFFQGPGPIYAPGRRGPDWWRLGRFLHACGIGRGDVLQNCFSYHLTPAGMMFESAAEAVGAAVVPAGPDGTELQVRAARDAGSTAYAGSPDYLRVILEAADAAGVVLGFRCAAVSGDALTEELRDFYEARGIACRECYATADLGLVAYESPACEGLVVDEGVVVEIVRPGTGDPVPDGEVGEVVVTTLNPDYPLVRFATGDLSAALPGPSSCGRTNMRIRGRLGRADQATEIMGTSVRPEQVAALVARHPEVERARVVAERAADGDVMTVQIEARAADPEAVAASVLAVLKLRGTVEILPPGGLPNDGVVIEDRRTAEALCR